MLADVNHNDMVKAKPTPGVPLDCIMKVDIYIYEYDTTVHGKRLVHHLHLQRSRAGVVTGAIVPPGSDGPYDTRATGFDLVLDTDLLYHSALTQSTQYRTRSPSFPSTFTITVAHWREYMQVVWKVGARSEFES